MAKNGSDSVSLGWWVKFCLGVVLGLLFYLYEGGKFRESITCPEMMESVPTGECDQGDTMKCCWCRRSAAPPSDTCIAGSPPAAAAAQ